MSTENVTATSTTRQLDFVLEDIAQCAKTIRHLAIVQAGVPQEMDEDAVRYSIQTIAERIGMLAEGADILARKTPDAYARVAASWMMPPAYHYDPETDA